MPFMATSNPWILLLKTSTSHRQAGWSAGRSKYSPLSASDVASLDHAYLKPMTFWLILHAGCLTVSQRFRSNSNYGASMAR